MKKYLIFFSILIISFTACKKEEESRITFSLKNMTTLLGETSDYISNVSPGEKKQDEDAYLYYFLENEIDGIDQAQVYYSLNSIKECDYIDILSNYANSLDNADTLMDLAESEFGTAEYYYLSYYNDSSTLQEVTYHTTGDLLTCIDTAGVKVNNVEQIFGLYHYDKYFILAGGYYSYDYGCFISLIEIGYYDKLAKSKKNLFFNNAV